MRKYSKIFEFGSCRLTHGKITISPINRATPGPHGGSCRATLCRNGNLLDQVLFYGFTANIRLVVVGHYFVWHARVLVHFQGKFLKNFKTGDTPQQKCGISHVSSRKIARPTRSGPEIAATKTRNIHTTCLLRSCLRAPVQR